MFHIYFPIISPAIFVFVVIILGLITPGYNPVNYTISRLAIEQYGWIQSLNFFQLAIAFSILGNTLSSEIRQSSSKIAIRTIFILSSIFLVIAGTFPADRIENIPLRFSIYTPLGRIHAGSVLLFLAASPFGIHRLASILSSEPRYKRYSAMTKIVGSIIFAASIIWLYCFAMGIGLEYRGITQKIIVFIVLGWFTLISLASKK